MLRRQEGLKRAEGMYSLEFFSEAGKRIRIEWTGCSLVQDGERTTLKFLDISLDRRILIGEEGAILPQSLTLFQKDTLEGPICLCREDACSRWGLHWIGSLTCAL